MTDASHITLLPRLLSRVRALAPGVALEAGRIDGELPGFLGMPAILSTTDLIATLPRHQYRPSIDLYATHNITTVLPVSSTQR